MPVCLNRDASKLPSNHVENQIMPFPQPNRNDPKFKVQKAAVPCQTERPLSSYDRFTIKHIRFAPSQTSPNHDIVTQPDLHFKHHLSMDMAGHHRNHRFHIIIQVRPTLDYQTLLVNYRGVTPKHSDESLNCLGVY